MKAITSEKLTIIGAAGMIGSNMAQSAILMGLSSEICLYDPYAKGLKGVAEELLQCGFKGVNITYTDNIEEALQGSKYIVNSGGAARKEGMTREDLLKGNAEIAIQFGKDVKKYCPDVKHIVVIFNPADITGLLVLLYSRLKPSQVTTLAALDSTRLRNELAKHFNINPDKVENCRTYGGHGEQMAVFSSTAKVDGKPLNDLIGTSSLTIEQWEDIKQRVIQGGKTIMDLRGRSSFQSPSYLSLEMIRAAMGGDGFDWPVGAYVSNDEFNHVMMAMETTLDKTGVHYKDVKGTKEEHEELKKSYKHLCDLRDELIGLGAIPPIKEWKTINNNL
jgi:malate dehydrogenase